MPATAWMERKSRDCCYCFFTQTVIMHIRSRIRTVKPDMWVSPRMARVSMQAHLLFIALLNFADDEGVITSNARLLQCWTMALREEGNTSDVAQWCKELEDAGCLVRFVFEGREYFMIRGFTEHQKINRPTPSAIPPEILGGVRQGAVHRNESQLHDNQGEHRHGISNTRTAEHERHDAPLITQVEAYFKKHRHTTAEAKKFYTYYVARAWKPKGATHAVAWQSLADHWISRSDDFSAKKHSRRKGTKNEIADNTQEIVVRIQ